MKKTIFSLMALGILTMSALGCKKETETPPSTTGTATVEGYIKVNSNERNDTLPNGNYNLNREAIPSSVVVTFVIDSRDLERNPDPSFNYEMIQKTTNVDANGKYSITLPTPKGSNTINGEMRISAFEYNPIITSSQNTDSTDVRVVVPVTTMNFSIYNGGKTIIDHNF